MDLWELVMIRKGKDESEDLESGDGGLNQKVREGFITDAIQTLATGRANSGSRAVAQWHS